MLNSEHETGARTIRSARQPPARSPADQPEHGRSADRPAQPVSTHRGEFRWAAVVGTLAVALAGFATWYGFLESGGAHPLLKLGGAMALAGTGMALLVLVRPVNRALSADHAHSALVEVHPIVLGLAWASMSAALIHFAVIEQHLVARQS